MRNSNLLPERICAFFKFPKDVSTYKVDCHCIVRTGNDLISQFRGVDSDLVQNPQCRHMQQWASRSYRKTALRIGGTYHIVNSNGRTTNWVGTYWSKIPPTSRLLSWTSRRKRLANIKSESHCTKTLERRSSSCQYMRLNGTHLQVIEVSEVWIDERHNTLGYLTSDVSHRIQITMRTNDDCGAIEVHRFFHPLMLMKRVHWDIRLFARLEIC